jgi:nitronate monooxygenase
MQTPLCARLGIPYPIIQAPMASVTTPGLVAAVSNAGGLGSLGALTLPARAIVEQSAAIRTLTKNPFNLNLFVLDPARIDDAQIARVLKLLAPAHAELGLPPPKALTSYGQSLQDQLDAIVEAKPRVASFHIGLLDACAVARLKQAGIFVIGSATNVAEAKAWVASGADAVCAQGAEAGGHRGTFIGDVQASMIGTMALVPQVVDAVDVPVIAAGGIMDGRGIAAALALGAQAVQLGTTFLSSAEASTPPVWRNALRTAVDTSTTLTKAFTGRHARGIANEFMRYMVAHEDDLPPYSVHSALTGDMRRAAAGAGRGEFLSMWAGQAASLTGGRSADISAARLVADLVEETKRVLAHLVRLHAG